MNSLERILYQRHKEQKALKLFLLCSMLGSLAIHGLAMTVRVGNVWNAAIAPTQTDEMEVVVEETPVEPSTAAPTVPELEEPPTAVATMQEVAIASQLAPAPIPLAPNSQAPLPSGQDAPSKDAPAPQAAPVNPMTNSVGETPAPVGGAGAITDPEGKGFGFGFSNLGTGFHFNGKPTGQPDGQVGGREGGKSGGVPNGQPGGQMGNPNGSPNATVVRTAPPRSDRPRKPVCLDCPKPKFRGSEGSPRVTYDIGADGRVINVRLRQSSGNPDLDRATLETLSKWRFDPATVPEGGRQNVRARVTFEEEGSTYQRQNEQRRREVKRRQVTEQEQRQGERQPTVANDEPFTKPVPAPAKKPDTIAPPEQPTPTTAPVEPVAPMPPTPIPASPEIAPPVPIEPLEAPVPVEAASPTSSSTDDKTP